MLRLLLLLLGNSSELFTGSPPQSLLVWELLLLLLLSPLLTCALHPQLTSSVSAGVGAGVAGLFLAALSYAEEASFFRPAARLAKSPAGKHVITSFRIRMQTSERDS
jgi:hypothetical protein